MDIDSTSPQSMENKKYYLSVAEKNALKIKQMLTIYLLRWFFYYGIGLNELPEDV